MQGNGKRLFSVACCLFPAPGPNFHCFFQPQHPTLAGIIRCPPPRPFPIWSQPRIPTGPQNATSGFWPSGPSATGSTPSAPTLTSSKRNRAPPARSFPSPPFSSPIANAPGAAPCATSGETPSPPPRRPEPSPPRSTSRSQNSPPQLQLNKKVIILSAERSAKSKDLHFLLPAR